VFRPTLLARIEQPDFSACRRVNAVRLDTLVAVAHPASLPQVLFVVRATARLRDDVIKFQRAEYVLLRTVAIAASVACLMRGRAFGFLWR